MEQYLPPGEQYRQLSLILLISGGADTALMDALAPRDTIDEGRAGSKLSPDDYKTPLIRIVDQEASSKMRNIFSQNTLCTV